MGHDQDILTEFNTGEQKRPVEFTLLLILIAVYNLTIPVLTYAALNPGLVKSGYENWEPVILVLILPVAGFFLLLGKIRFGWAICLFYYLGVLSFFTILLYQVWQKEGLDVFNLLSRWRAYLLILVIFFILYLLLSKKTRGFLLIRKSILINALIISLVLISALIFFFKFV